MVPADEVDARLLHQRPDVGGSQMRDGVVVGGRKVRDHAARMAGDDHAAAAGRRRGGDVVFGADAGGGAGGAEGRGGGVGADAADVEGAVGGEHVLRVREWG